MKDQTMSRGDVAALTAFMVAGAGIAVWTVVRALSRVGEVLSGGDVRVLAEFAGTSADAPIGPAGAPVAVELDTAYLVVSDLPGASIAALVIKQIVVIAAVLTVVVCLLALGWSILRGRVFRRVNTVLVTTAGMVGLIGFALVPFFANMGANGAFARISDRTFDNVFLTVDLFPLVFFAFVAALASMVFAVGERLQRDTEGLV